MASPDEPPPPDNDRERATPDGGAPDAPRKRGVHVFRPDRMVGAVSEVTPDDLEARGVRGVILDLDNTIVHWSREDMADEILDWLDALQGRGFRLCILSNSVLSRRSERIAERLGCFLVRGGRKPARRGFLRAMELLGTGPGETAIVGDQMFTDIWGGNRVGIHTVMVRPLAAREFLYTRLVNRPPERLLLRWFRRRGHL